MIVVTHLADLESEDNGYYWQEAEDDCDIFGPFDTHRQAETAGLFRIFDQQELNRHSDQL